MDQSQIIALKDIDSTYKTKNQEQLYLKNINLSITAGETLGVIGRSGAGKSALLRCISLLERPLTGIIAIDSKNLTFMASKELCAERRSIAYLSPKAIFLQHKNVLQNVALPLRIQGYGKHEVMKPVEQALARVGIESKALSFISSLTQLQKIQVDLARSLVNNPKILICDDLFTGLDHKSVEFLSNLLLSLQKDLKLTMIIASNDAEIIKSMCQNVIVMQQGKIVESCSVLQLFSEPKSDTAKEFVRFAAKLELPISLRKKIVAQENPNNHAIVRISFSDCLAPEEILSNALEAFELKMNIIQAYQDKIYNQVLNIMLLEVYGASSTIQEALQFLTSNSLHSEIIGYVPNLN